MILGYCSFNKLYSDKKGNVEIGNFEFSVRSCEKGWHVEGWVVAKDIGVYKIIDVIFCHSSNRVDLYNLWESGMWDDALAQAITTLEHAVETHELETVIQHKIDEIEQEKYWRERKAKFEALFV